MATLQQATELLQAGRLIEAQAALAELLRQNPNSDQAWLLMSFAVSERSLQIDCAQRAVKLNPFNPNARERLEKLVGPPASSAPPPASTPPPAEPPRATSFLRKTGALSMPTAAAKPPAAPEKPAAEAKPPAETKSPESAARDLFSETSTPLTASKAEKTPPPAEEESKAPETSDWLSSLREESAAADEEPASQPEKPKAGAGEEKAAGAAKAAEKPKGKAKAPAKENKKSSAKDKKAAPKPKGKAPRWLGLLRLIILLGLLLGLVGAAFVLWPSIQQNFLRRPTAQAKVKATASPTATETVLPTATPSPTPRFAGLPPTWTPTFTPTVSPTRLPPTATPLPPTVTLRVAGSTAQAQMNALQQQVIELRQLELVNEAPGYVAKPSIYTNKVSAQYTDAYMEWLNYQGWMLKALGLIAEDYDWMSYAFSSNATSLPSVYVPWERQILVMNTRIEGSDQVVYVHEFTLALIDQHYPFDSLGISFACQGETERCTAARALVEGDATLTMYQWWGKFNSKAEKSAFWYFAPPDASASGQTPPLFSAPDYLFVYDYGYEFAKTLYSYGGWKKVNQAYAKPPTTSEQIMHPEKYLVGEMPVPVSLPALELGDDWVVAGTESLGEWRTYLLLGYSDAPDFRLEDKEAKQAASGWGGDQMQLYRSPSSGQSALQVHWAWDNATAAQRFEKAFLNYQALRFADELSLEGAQCGAQNGQVSCLLSREKESIWLLAPSQDLMQQMLAPYKTEQQ